MANWVNLTQVGGGDVLVNLEVASTIVDLGST